MKAVLWIVLVVVLGASLGGNVWLASTADRLYRDAQALRLDPLELGAVAGRAAPADARRPVFVFFGDSRAALWPAPAGRDAFAFVNLGIGGQTSAQVAGRFASQVLPLAPRAMLLQVGINDVKSIALFPHRQAEIAARCKANIDAIVAQARHAGIEVWLTTVFPVGEPTLLRRRYWSDGAAAALEDVNRHIRGLAGAGVTIMDTQAVLAPEGRLQPQYAADFLHLTPAGYAALNAALAPLLDERPGAAR